MANRCGVYGHNVDATDYSKMPSNSEDTVSLRSAARETRATLYAVLNRLELNDLDGEEQPYIDDCLGALAILEEALR